MSSFSNVQLDVENIPTITSIQFRGLHPKYCWINLTDLVPWLVIPSIPLVIVITQVKALAAYNGILWTLLVMFYFVSLVLSFLRAKARFYALREHDVLFQSGLFWQKTTAVAFNRIQHIDLTHGPLERKYQIASLKFFTAGGGAVDLKVPGLPEQDAEQMRALILSKINQDETIDKNSEDEAQHDN